jgi:hypothetical protein
LRAELIFYRLSRVSLRVFDSAFRRIARDERHEELRIIGFSLIDASLFGSWGMRGIGAFEFKLEIEEELKHRYGEDDGGIALFLELHFCFKLTRKLIAIQISIIRKT